MEKLFGTDGMRGKANLYPMIPELIVEVGKAVASVVKEKNKKKRHSIVIGKDTRLSGYMLESALTSGIVSMGVDVLLVGPMPTPAIAHLTKSLNADAGIVLSASHNHSKDNGIKIFDGEGFKLDDKTEAKIEKLVFSKKIVSEHITGEAIGKAHRIDDAKGRYIEVCKASIKSNSLKGLKIVLDCANGAAYKVAPQIFSELGADVIPLFVSPNGYNINFDCGALHPEVIQREVKKHRADIGIALDGDADRVIVCDEKGKNVDGDHIMAICALDLLKQGKLNDNTVVSTVMSNLGFIQAMEKAGINVVKTRVGDRYVVSEMRNSNYVLGGEQSGHIVFTNYSTTGDGIISALQLLNIMQKEKKKLSELAKCMKTFPQVLLNVKVREKRPLSKMKSVSKKIREVEKILGENGRVLVRYSGTENLCRVMLEGKNQKEINKLANQIASEVKKVIGKK